MSESSHSNAISQATLQGLRERCAEQKATIVALEGANAVREEMLQSAAAQLELTRAELEHTRAELEHTRAELEHARAELERIRAELGVGVTESGMIDAPVLHFTKWKARRWAGQLRRRGSGAHGAGES